MSDPLLVVPLSEPEHSPSERAGCNGSARGEERRKPFIIHARGILRLDKTFTLGGVSRSAVRDRMQAFSSQNRQTRHRERAAGTSGGYTESGLSGWAAGRDALGCGPWEYQIDKV